MVASGPNGGVRWQASVASLMHWVGALSLIREPPTTAAGHDSARTPRHRIVGLVARMSPSGQLQTRARHRTVRQ